MTEQHWLQLQTPGLLEWTFGDWVSAQQQHKAGMRFSRV